MNKMIDQDMKPGKIAVLHKINMPHAECIKIAWLTSPAM